jgi:hypothetical protein
MRAYRFLTEPDKYSTEYMKMFEEDKAAAKLLELPQVRTLCHNFILALSIIYGLRYCVQRAMLKSVTRLLEFLEGTDFARREQDMQDMISLAVDRWAREWEEFRLGINRLEGPASKELIASHSDGIPNVGPDSIIGKVHAQLQYDSSKAIANAAVSELRASRVGEQSGASIKFVETMIGDGRDQRKRGFPTVAVKQVSTAKIGNVFLVAYGSRWKKGDVELYKLISKNSMGGMAELIATTATGPKGRLTDSELDTYR